jgi:hypothetical protein
MGCSVLVLTTRRRDSYLSRTSPDNENVCVCCSVSSFPDSAHEHKENTFSGGQHMTQSTPTQEHRC